MNDRPLVFFIDRCLGKHFIVDALKQTGITIEIHDHHFDQSTLDTEWIPEIGKRGWIILTKDAKIGRNHLERQALARSGGNSDVYSRVPKSFRSGHGRNF